MARHKIYMIKAAAPSELYWSGQSGWVEKEKADLFTEMDKQRAEQLATPVLGEWEVLKTIPKPKVASETDFYLLVEGFIGKHSGTDRVSQEFEHLATKLKHKDPEYVAAFAALPKATVQAAMLFTYKMMQQS